METTYQNPITEKLVASLYRNDETGKPIKLTPGQHEIFDIIAGRLYPRNWVGCYTRYGKSFTVGLGVLTRVSTYPEKWTIIAPQTDKARIIMGVIIDHLFDNEAIAKKFEIEKGENVDRIRRERSKDRLTFKMTDGSIGGVQILSAQGQKRQNINDAVMGFGSKNLVLDESSLLPDEHWAGVVRMLGDDKDNFLMQIGNPIYRNHFYKASRNPDYHKIRIDWRQGVKEGRVTREFIEEVQNEMRSEIFRWMYDVKFPEADALDQDGYSPLVTERDLERSRVAEVQLVGEVRMGVDASGGGRNKTVVTVRARNAAKTILKTANGDPMIVGPKIIHYAKKYHLKKRSLFVDMIGVGFGLFKYLEHELGNIVVGVNFGEAAENMDPTLQGMQFLNLRAQAYWRSAEWINKGSKLKDQPGWDQYEDIKYKIQTDKKIKIKSKDEMLKEGISSPDDADSLALTFSTMELPEPIPYKPEPYVPASPYEGGEQDRGGDWRDNIEKKDVHNERGFGRYAQNY